MVNASADDLDTMVDDQSTVLPEKSHEIPVQTPQPQPAVPTPRPQTSDPRPWTQTPETQPHIGLECLVLLTPQIPHPAAPTLREAEASRNTSAVDVEQELLSESGCGDCLPDGALPNVPLPDVPLPHTCPDSSAGEEWTTPCGAEMMCVRVRVGFLSCELPLP